MSASDQQSGTEAQIRDSLHGFFDPHGDIEELTDSYECTIFITDTELVLGDQGEFQPAGGLLEVLPEALTGIANKILADDEPTTISFDTAVNRPGTKQIDLTDIIKIEVEKGLPPLGKHLVEIEYGNHREVTVFVGTADSYGEKEETQEFVNKLETAANDAGGSPRVTKEYDI
jgi:hypothetical protein